MNYCPMCDGEGVLLGQLGRLVHFRCRQCGMGFHTEVEPEDEDACQEEAD